MKTFSKTIGINVSSRRHAGPAARPIILFVLALLGLLAALPPASTTSHSSSSRIEIVDPGTGFVVCRSSSWVSSPPNFHYSVSQCLGRCLDGQYETNSRRSLTRQDENDPTSVAELGYACTSNRTFSCVRSASNSCHWIGVRGFSRGQDFNSTHTVPYFRFGCYGPASGVCTWFEDRFCLKIVPPGLPSAPGGGVNCSSNQSSWDPHSWCAEGYDYLVNQITPSTCPNVTEKQVLGPAYYREAKCIHSCEHGGRYLKVLREGTREPKVMCTGGTRYSKRGYITMCSSCERRPYHRSSFYDP